MFNSRVVSSRAFSPPAKANAYLPPSLRAVKLIHNTVLTSLLLLLCMAHPHNVVCLAQDQLMNTHSHLLQLSSRNQNSIQYISSMGFKPKTSGPASLICSFVGTPCAAVAPAAAAALPLGFRVMRHRSTAWERAHADMAQAAAAASPLK